ncbi:hypothetical protein GOBAR_AA08276 [Gossypium barbadense]|uniref:SWIM-type domain-containing protein n=1 Tax=Gossypium barbadense TaxID=3634 RepID=A0A2P5YA17_GOSBA|nr:hypothetical protein GOBAR_AA08276 [Gossypium barbadense]
MTNNGEDSDQDVEDFSDPDIDEVPDDINDEGLEEVEDVHGPSFYSDAAHASEFPEYADIVPAHRLASNSQFDELFVGQQFENKADCVFAIKQYSMKLSIDYKVPWRSVYCIRHIAVNFHNEYKNKDWRKRIVNMEYELEPHRFRHKLTRLETDMAGCKPSLTQWLSSMEPWQWAQCFDEGYRYGHMTTNLVEVVNSVLRRTRHLPISAVFSAIFYSRRSGIPPRSYRVDLRNKRCECGMFQALRYPCAHVVAACATYSLNVEQYIDDVYMLERTLRIWGNEFPILSDISTWEVQSPAFEMLPDRSLRRRVKGRPTITWIRNDMDVREQVDPKRCTICRTVGHNRSKCPHGNVYTGQSSRSERN